MSRSRFNVPLTHSTWTLRARSTGEAITRALMMQSSDHGQFFRAWNESRRPELQGR
jgi:hypothetical protein